MSLKVPNEGENVLLSQIQSYFNGGNVKIKLFTNNITPGDSDTISTYTEASFPGYAAVTVNSWGSPATNGSGDSQITETTRTWTRSSTGTTQNVYGYYVVDTATSKLLFAEIDPRAPVAMTNAGDAYSVLPVFTLASKF